jgi:dTDP-L-rhamnose 4-epimerase
LASSRAVYGEGLYRCPCCGEVAPSGREPAALRDAAWEPVCPRCGGVIAAIATHEDAPLQPGSVYAATKAAQERLVQIVGGAYGMPTTILRYFNVYGPGQSLANPYTGILSTFCTRARSGKTIDVYEDGRESRDFVYIDDVVAATRQSLALSPEDGQTHVVNVGTGIPISIGDLAHTLLDLGGWDVPINVTGAFRVGDVRHAYADITRMRRLLPSVSVTPLAEGLRHWLRWAEANEVHDATEVALSRLKGEGLYRSARER